MRCRTRRCPRPRRGVPSGPAHAVPRSRSLAGGAGRVGRGCGCRLSGRRHRGGVSDCAGEHIRGSCSRGRVVTCQRCSAQPRWQREEAIWDETGGAVTRPAGGVAHGMHTSVRSLHGVTLILKYLEVCRTQRRRAALPLNLTEEELLGIGRMHMDAMALHVQPSARSGFLNCTNARHQGQFVSRLVVRFARNH